MKHWALIFTLLAGSGLMFGADAQAQLIYMAGHADINLGYEAGSGVLDLHQRHDIGAMFENGTELTVKTKFAPQDVITRVPDPPFIRTDFFFWDFLPGVPVGSPVWINPQLQDDDRPWHGFATDELIHADWVGTRDSILWSLTSFSGPAGGEFVLYEEDWLGLANVLVDTHDGLTVEDNFNVIYGHAHYNWPFTKAGVYHLEFTATGEHVVDGQVSGSGAFTFYVGNAIPEPGSLGLSLAALLAIVVTRNRQS